MNDQVVTYSDLTEEERVNAVSRARLDLLQGIVGGVRFNDDANEDDFQARIDAAIKKADEMQTPWFAHEYIEEDTYCSECISGMATASAENALYSLPGVVVIAEIAHGKS